MLFLVLQVTVFSTSEKKRAEALKTLKADHFVVSKDEEQMKVSRLRSCLCAYMRVSNQLHFCIVYAACHLFGCTMVCAIPDTLCP